MSDYINSLPTDWGSLTVRDKFSYCLACASFVVGWLLVFASFILSDDHSVDSSVLACLGSALVFCASCLGISYHYSSELDKFKSEIRNQLKEKV